MKELVSQGLRYERGDGVGRDEARAAELYRQACEEGSAWGCGYLGVLHNYGRGVGKDLAAAVRLLLASAARLLAKARARRLLAIAAALILLRCAARAI